MSRKMSAGSITAVAGSSRRLNVSSCLVRSFARRTESRIVLMSASASSGKLIAKKLGVPADDGEDVVEVVGDPAGEATDCLHLLRLAHLLLELLLSGDVLDHRDGQLGRSGVGEVDVDVDDVSVAPDETTLERRVVSLSRHRCRIDVRIEVVRMDDVADAHRRELVAV